MPLLVLVCLAVAWLAPVARAASPPGPWVAPVEPLLVRRAFAPPATKWGAGHRGVDLAAYAGAPVRAAGAGRVTFAGVLAGRGVVVVTHGALRTTYEPVRALLPPGRAVAAGTVVGTLAAGHAGAANAAESLLHWGLLHGETYLDPLSLLRRGPSRLVPVAPAPPAAEAGAAAGAVAAPVAPFGPERPPRGAGTAVAHARVGGPGVTGSGLAGSGIVVSGSSGSGLAGSGGTGSGGTGSGGTGSAVAPAASVAAVTVLASAVAARHRRRVPRSRGSP